MVKRGRMLGACWLALASVVAAAQAAEATTTHVSGSQTVISCLGPRLCMLGGRNGSGFGDLVSVRDGVPEHYYAIRKTTNVTGLSCPSAAGCVAVDTPKGISPYGLTVTGVAAKLTIINRSGVPTRTVPLTLPPQRTLGRIACTSLHSCVLTGEFVTDTKLRFLIGDWNGHSLKLRYARAPSRWGFAPLPNGSHPQFGHMACSGAVCVLVGWVEDVNAVTRGYVLSIRNGKPVGLHIVPGDVLFGVSCASPTLCHADGETASADPSFVSHAVVVTVKNGRETGAPITINEPSASLNGIVCVGGTCTAAGSFQALGSKYSSGLLVTISPDGTQTDAAFATGYGFDDEAVAGSDVAAIGPANPSGSELAIS